MHFLTLLIGVLLYPTTILANNPDSLNNVIDVETLSKREYSFIGRKVYGGESIQIMANWLTHMFLDHLPLLVFNIMVFKTVQRIVVIIMPPVIIKPIIIIVFMLMGTIMVGSFQVVTSMVVILLEMLHQILVFTPIKLMMLIQCMKLPTWR